MIQENDTPSRQNLETVADNYSQQIIAGWEHIYHLKWRYTYRKLKEYARPGRALEMGCADGQMTDLISRDFEHTTVIDGSKKFIDLNSEKLAGRKIEFVHCLFEEFSPMQKFDTIFLVHVLEHLRDPIEVLRKAANWLAPQGRILVHVPNSNSLHRHIGVKMGLLKTNDSLNEQDIKLGHYRVYDFELLRSHLKQAGLREIASGGVGIKPLSNRQMNDWDQPLIEAFLKLGDEFPEISSEIFVVAEKA
jgi:SAM-dependent methyltransferase